MKSLLRSILPCTIVATIVFLLTACPTPDGPETNLPTIGELPVVNITSPLPAMRFLEGEEVTLRGAAVDAEDGELTGTSLSWESSLDGSLGTGAVLSTDTLSIGGHLINLTAVDSAGNPGLDTLSLIISAVIVPTEHFGAVSGNEVWTPQENPHVITGDLTIAGSPPDGATLTIEAGCVVKFDQYRLISVGPTGIPGALIAQGTEENPITFTCNLTTPQNGWWDFVAFQIADTGSILQHCIIEYGGGDTGGWKSNLIINEASNVTIEDCTVRNSPFQGLEFITASGSVIFSGNNVFTANEGYGIKMFANQSDSITATTSVAGNTLGGVYLRSGVITTDTTWHNLDAPYLIESVGVRSLSEPILSIMAGTEIEFTDYTSLTSGSDTESGQIFADGTDAAITFTGATQTPGFWRFIAFYSNDTGSVLRNCIIEYGGGDGGDWWGNLIINGAPNVTIEDCIVRNSLTQGIEFITTAGAVTLSGSNVFTGNDGYGIRMYSGQSDGIGESTSVAGNTAGGVYLRGGVGAEITTDTTWHNLDAPYIVESAVVQGSPYPTLTIEAGTAVQLTAGGYLRSASETLGGKIIADGTAAAITFTGTVPNPGLWRFIVFYPQDIGSIFENCNIEYGGGDGGGWKGAVVNNGALSAAVTNSSIENAGQHGTVVLGGSLNLDGIGFLNNGTWGGTWYDIMVSGGEYTGTPTGTYTENP
jgi:hypothetical protein